MNLQKYGHMDGRTDLESEITTSDKIYCKNVVSKQHARRNNNLLATLLLGYNLSLLRVEVSICKSDA